MATEGWRVVRAVLDGAVGDVVVGGHHTQLALTGSLLEVAIGDSTGRVIGRHKGAPDVVRKEVAPDARLQFFIHEDTAQAEAGAIRCPDEGWVFRYYLSEMRRARAEIGDQGFERVEMVADIIGNPDSAIRGTVEG